MASIVTAIPAASPDQALAHFATQLSLETDCWDVHHALANGQRDFVLLDVRGSDAYRRGHLPQAISLPHREIGVETLTPYPADSLFVVYCAGPHCNGADRAALQLARLGRAVKKMIGGVTGWLDEGFALVAER